MKLALFISSLRSGGAERVLSNLANHWAQHGHDVHLITFASREEIPFYPLDKKITVHPLNLFDDTSSGFKRIVTITKRLITIRKVSKTLKPDRILSFIDITNITVLIATFGLRFPVIVSERSDPHFHKIPYLYQKIRFLIYRFAQSVVVQTNSAQSFFKDQNNVKIIANAVLLPDNLKENCDPLHHIISVGRLIKTKDFELLIKCFSNIYLDFPHVTLVIYGEGPERENLEDLIRHLSLTDRVFLPGVVTNIQEKLVEADLFVFPSQYEGFPNALCEAMAVGLPVIASNCSGNVDVVQDGSNGVLFSVGDEKTLTERMRHLLDHPELRMQLGQKAAEISQTYSPEKIYTLWDEIVIK